MSLATPTADGPATVEGPDGRRREVPLHPQGDYHTLTDTDTLSSGIYTVRVGSSAGVERFAVNVDPVESDLRQLRPDRLRNDVWPGIPWVYQSTWEGVEQPSAAPIVRAGHLHVDLLYAALALVLVETLLAWRFGHQSR
jgi:hypothetical protein